jgi:hypothetical protein
MDKERQELLVKLYEGSEARLVRWQTERATMAQIMMAAVTVLSAGIFSSRTTAESAYQLLGFGLIAVGIIGFIFVQKYHERVQLYKYRMEGLLTELGDPRIISIFDDAETKALGAYPYWYHWSLYKVYSFMMIAIVLYGIVVVVLSPRG